MKRPEVISGLTANWVVYADELEAKLEVYEYALKKIAAEKETLGWLYAGQIAEKALDREIVYPDEAEIPVDRAGRKMYNKFGDKLDIADRS
jgi:hypothetical protein